MVAELVEKAFAEVSKLPEQEQEAVAAWILEELAAERRWEKAFVDSQGELAHLAEEALAEYHTGKTKPLDPNRL